jgi:hypothetical protein
MRRQERRRIGDDALLVYLAKNLEETERRIESTGLLYGRDVFQITANTALRSESSLQ